MNKELERPLEHLMSECCRKCESHKCEKGNKRCPFFRDYLKIKTTFTLLELCRPDEEKKLKTFEIIKNKGIDILKLKECAKCKTPDEYNKRTSYFYHKDLDQEEYDLAKETLL